MSLIKKVKSKVFSKVPLNNYGLNLIRPLTDRMQAPPLFTSSALRPITLATVINDVVINGRNRVVDLGTGATTFYLAKAIELYELDCELISVDDDQDWLAYIERGLRREGLADKVKLVYAPLTDYGSRSWYQKEALNFLLEADEPAVDCLIVDGPKANRPGIDRNRQDALPFFFDKLGERCSIFLDDLDRKGEQLIMAEWSEQYNLNFNLFFRSAGIATRGSCYNFYPY